jgi:excisionase family DNA binding protein
MSLYQLIEADRLEAIEILLKSIILMQENLIARFEAFESNKSAVMNVVQIADYLGKTVPSIRGLVARAEIPYSKVGGALSFTKSDIDNWINSKRKLTKSELLADATERLN